MTSICCLSKNKVAELLIVAIKFSRQTTLTNQIKTNYITISGQLTLICIHNRKQKEIGSSSQLKQQQSLNTSTRHILPWSFMRNSKKLRTYASNCVTSDATRHRPTLVLQPPMKGHEVVSSLVFMLTGIYSKPVSSTVCNDNLSCLCLLQVGVTLNFTFINLN